MKLFRAVQIPFDPALVWCWLKTVARNAARDAGRKQRRYITLLEKLSLHWSATEQETNDGCKLCSPKV